MNYYKSKSCPKNFKGGEITVNGDYYYFAVPFEMDGELIAKEEFNEVKSLEINSTQESFTETEQAILETAINTEYLVCLAELGL